MAQVINGHWTNRSTKAFVFRIAFDFITQIEQMMEAEKVSPGELAKRLDVTKGRVSQIMNNPKNMNLQTVVEWAQALGVKVALVAYDDEDVNNDNGPVNPQIFTKCWEKSGRPTDFFAAGMFTADTSSVEVDQKWRRPPEMRIAKDDFAAELQALDIDPSVWQRLNDPGIENAGTDAD